MRRRPSARCTAQVRISPLERFRGYEKFSMQIEFARYDDDLDMKPTITPREEQLLSLVRRGMTNAEIARRLDVREQTVKIALAVLFQKCHVRNRTQLALASVEVRKMRSGRGG